MAEDLIAFYRKAVLMLTQMRTYKQVFQLKDIFYEMSASLYGCHSWDCLCHCIVHYTNETVFFTEKFAVATTDLYVLII